jgi:GDP-4-dehydro-6-deoxy-D-mannose reductase
MRCLVTGATGFIGSFLVERLVEAGHEVTAMARPASGPRAPLPAGVEVVRGVVEQRSDCAAAVAAARPERVYHLAAQSYPQRSWQAPHETVRVNVLGTLNVMEAIRQGAPSARVLVAGSSSEYAPKPDGGAITEQDRMDPSSPYGVSKLAAEHGASLFAERYQLHMVRVRPFFLIGPRKTGDACSDFARGIVAAERAGQGSLRTGNLDIVRDLLDVRDGVNGFMTALEQGQSGETYNVCSGQAHRLRDVLDRMKAMCRVPLAEQVDPALLRPVDEPVKVGDPSRLRALGWRPVHPLDDSLSAILDYWRRAP